MLCSIKKSQSAIELRFYALLLLLLFFFFVSYLFAEELIVAVCCKYNRPIKKYTAYQDEL